MHKFKDVQDLKRRVGPGRRVFALMNKGLPTEPLVFVQVALVNTLSDNVQDILNDPSPGHVNPAETVKCAIFYSITTQVGKYFLFHAGYSILIETKGWNRSLLTLVFITFDQQDSPESSWATF